MCTTIAIGKNATIDGSVIIAHSDDDVGDERVIFVPATIGNKPGSMRPVYYDNAALGPDMTDPNSGKKYNASELYRYVGSSRGPGYVLNPMPPGIYNSIEIGEIPQVSETYSYFDSSYGVMNEKGLMIGECTCGAKVHPLPSKNRLFYSAELSRVALERCKKAKDAIKLMGDLIKQYGYYGTGETLLIGDSDEAWVMEMCGYDMNGSDGLWVAQRVPDNGFFVESNQFRIRDVELDSANMMFSDNLHDVCKRLGWWDPDKNPKLDWAATVSYGEYSHPYYSLRRVWRALTKAKPSSNLPAWVEGGYTKAYPFTVIPDVKLDIAGVAAVYRDHYEGTEFDMTLGQGAGPWHDPTRYENNPDQGNAFELSVNTPHGAWERPLSIYRCGMFWINQANAAFENKAVHGISWIGLDRPAANCLMPFFCQVTELPTCIATMNLLDFDLNSAWWVFNFVANYATIKYSYMMKDIETERKIIEDEEYLKVKDLRQKNQSVNELTKFCCDNAEQVRKAWWELAKKLIVTYNDGCRTTKYSVMKKIDYPEWWLNDAGYFQGPVSYNKEECRNHNFKG
jgi:dipeptidase